VGIDVQNLKSLESNSEQEEVMGKVVLRFYQTVVERGEVRY
jgi:hypothetical protein